MNFLLYGAIALLSLFALILLFLHIKTLRPVRSVLLHALLGIAAFVLINLTSRFTGVRLPLNWYTAAGSAVFGIPAVCGFLILGIII